MEEVENQGVEQPVAQELASPETETTHEETREAENTQIEDRNDRNWRALRQSKEELERKTRMQDELIQRILSQQQSAPSVQAQPEEDIIEELAKHEYVPGEVVAKGLRKIEEKFERKFQDAEKRYASQQQNQLLNSLKSQFPDFDDVVNSENLNILETQEPELANFIAESKDPYKIAVQSYKYLKATGIHTKAAPSKRARETEAKLEQNKKTVQTPMDKRPMAQAFSYDNLSANQKESLYNEMVGHARKVGMGY